ncbi:MAG: DUF2911 domain-containing protein [Ferruginibacter sp.]
MIKQPVIFLASLFFISSFTQCNNSQPKPGNSVVPDSNTVQNMYAPVDKSPMDMSYYPVDFPLQKMNGTAAEMPIARIIYSRPHKNGRVIFGTDDKSLCQYGLPWRLGANEATEITIFKNVNISGTNVNKGTYVLYCVPHADHWTLIFNRNLYTWGLHMDSTQDVLKTDVPVMAQQPVQEEFSVVFKDMPYGADLIMAWDNVKAAMPMEFSK